MGITSALGGTTLSNVQVLNQGLGTGIYLASYAVEAVGFTEYIYEEAVRQGMKVLNDIVNEGRIEEIDYFCDKFEINVLIPAYKFHTFWGILNPFCNSAFDAVYLVTISKFNAIKRLGFSATGQG